MEEIWKDVHGYEGLYQVSNLGNVKSLNWRGKKISKNLKMRPHNQGYYQVQLCGRGKRKNVTVHKLVALHFVDGYKDGLVVNHKNENKKDNRAENLEWVTISENRLYSLHQTERKTPIHRAYTLKKGQPITRSEKILQMDMDGKVLKEWESVISIKHSLGYSDWSIAECCRGNRRKAYGYKWQYATEYNSQERL